MLRRAVRLLAFCVPAGLALFLLSVVPRFGVPRGATPQSQDAAKAPAARKTVLITRAPLRHIEDPNPSFSSVSVDGTHDEIVLEDENLDRIVTYGRMDNTPKQAAFTEPKRIIGGSKTKISEKLRFVCRSLVRRHLQRERRYGQLSHHLVSREEG